MLTDKNRKEERKQRNNVTSFESCLNGKNFTFWLCVGLSAKIGDKVFRRETIQKLLKLKCVVVCGDSLEVSITTMSRNGQVVIPFDIRKALGIEPSEKFLVISEGDTIVLKRLKKELLKKELEGLFDYFTDAFSKAKITPEVAKEEIQAHRKKKRVSHASGN